MMELFFVVFENNGCIQKNTFAGAINIPGCKCIYKFWSTNNGHGHNLLNPTGEEGTFRIGEFECLSIERKGNSDVVFKIYSNKDDAVYETPSIKGFGETLIKQLKPTLELLNELGSWKAYENQLKVQELENANEVLRLELDELKNRLSNGEP